MENDIIQFYDYYTSTIRYISKKDIDSLKEVASFIAKIEHDESQRDTEKQN